MRLVDRLDMNRVSEMDPNTLRSEIRGVVEHLCDTENPLLNRNERQRLVSEILDETFGFGPLELLLKDEKIADIMINGPKKIFVEKEGRIQRSEVVFRDNEHLLQIIDRIVSRVGRRVDETSPMVDARLPERLAVQRDHPARCRSTAPRSRSGCSARSRSTRTTCSGSRRSRPRCSP